MIGEDTPVSSAQGNRIDGQGIFHFLYRQVSDPAKLAAYANRRSLPSRRAAAGSWRAGVAAKADEAGHSSVSSIEASISVEQAVADDDRAAYQQAPAALAGGAVRDVRIISGARVKYAVFQTLEARPMDDAAETSTPSADARAMVERLIAFNTVSRDSNLGLIEWARDYLAKLGATHAAHARCHRKEGEFVRDARAIRTSRD